MEYASAMILVLLNIGIVYYFLQADEIAPLTRSIFAVLCVLLSDYIYTATSIKRARAVGIPLWVSILLTMPFYVYTFSIGITVYIMAALAAVIFLVLIILPEKMPKEVTNHANAYNKYVELCVISGAIHKGENEWWLTHYLELDADRHNIVL